VEGEAGRGAAVAGAHGFHGGDGGLVDLAQLGGAGERRRLKEHVGLDAAGEPGAVAPAALGGVAAEDDDLVAGAGAGGRGDGAEPAAVVAVAAAVGGAKIGQAQPRQEHPRHGPW
jgi:hypothetical protein